MNLQASLEAQWIKIVCQNIGFSMFCYAAGKVAADGSSAWPLRAMWESQVEFQACGVPGLWRQHDLDLAVTGICIVNQ